MTPPKLNPHTVCGCRCCECQGRLCLAPHPGHSHRGPHVVGRVDLPEPGQKPPSRFDDWAADAEEGRRAAHDQAARPASGAREESVSRRWNAARAGMQE